MENKEMTKKSSPKHAKMKSAVLEEEKKDSVFVLLKSSAVAESSNT